VKVVYLPIDVTDSDMIELRKQITCFKDAASAMVRICGGDTFTRTISVSVRLDSLSHDEHEHVRVLYFQFQNARSAFYSLLERLGVSQLVAHNFLAAIGEGKRSLSFPLMLGDEWEAALSSCYREAVSH